MLHALAASSRSRRSSTLPLLVLVTRGVLDGGCSRANRENQEAIGRMSDRVLASLAGVRVVRSFALEERRGARASSATNQALPRGEPRASRGSAGRWGR